MTQETRNQKQTFQIPKTHLNLNRKSKFSSYRYVKIFLDMLRRSSIEGLIPNLYLDSSLIIALDKGIRPERIEAFKHLLAFTSGFFPTYSTTVCLPVFFEYSRKLIMNRQEFYACKTHIENILRKNGVLGVIFFEDCDNYTSYIKFSSLIIHDLEYIDNIVNDVLKMSEGDIDEVRKKFIIDEDALNGFTPTSGLVNGLKYLSNDYFSFLLSFKIGRRILPAKKYHKVHRRFMSEHVMKEKIYTDIVHRRKNFADIYILSRADIRWKYAKNIHVNILPVSYDKNIHEIFLDRSNRNKTIKDFRIGTREANKIMGIEEFFDDRVKLYFRSLLAMEAHTGKGLDYFKLRHLLFKKSTEQPTYGMATEWFSGKSMKQDQEEKNIF